MSPACMTELLYSFLLAKNFTLLENIPLSINTSKAILLSQACEYGKSHICVNMGLLEPVCLFWHKIPSDWQLRLDIPPAATTHAWLVMRNISLSSWLHTRHTKKYAHTLSKDLWHGSYIRLINLILKVMATWQLFCSGSMLDRWRPTVLLMRASSYLLVFELFWICMWNCLSHPVKYSPNVMKHKPLRIVKWNKITWQNGCFSAVMANWKQLRSDAVITRVEN